MKLSESLLHLTAGLTFSLACSAKVNCSILGLYWQRFIFSHIVESSTVIEFKDSNGFWLQRPKMLQLINYQDPHFKFCKMDFRCSVIMTLRREIIAIGKCRDIIAIVFRFSFVPNRMATYFTASRRAGSTF